MHSSPERHEIQVLRPRREPHLPNCIPDLALTLDDSKRLHSTFYMHTCMRARHQHIHV